MRPELLANAFASEATRWSTRTLTWLLLRALLLKEPATVVDTVPMPTLSPLRSPIRPRDEMCLFIVGACERMARCTCEPPVAGKEPRGVCMCIDLVSSSSIDDTKTVFSESDVLTWSIPTVRPVTQMRWPLEMHWRPRPVATGMFQIIPMKVQCHPSSLVHRSMHPCLCIPSR